MLNIWEGIMSLKGAVKIGMLSNPQCMKTVAEQMKHYKPLHIVVDPVMYAKNGCPLMDPSSIDVNS